MVENNGNRAKFDATNATYYTRVTYQDIADHMNLAVETLYNKRDELLPEPLVTHTKIKYFLWGAFIEKLVGPEAASKLPGAPRREGGQQAQDGPQEARSGDGEDQGGPK